MLAILDSLFHKVGPFDTKAFLWPTGFSSGYFQLHMSQNVAT